MLRLRKLGAEGEASERRLTADIEIVRLNEDGSSVLAPYGTLQSAPEGLDMPLPMIFDYDGDGQHEAIVRYEVERRPVVDEALRCRYCHRFSPSKTAGFRPTSVVLR